MHKPAVTQVPIDSTIANRWSGRAYDAAKTVLRNDIIALLEAARWAPSCYGDQPWRFVVWDKHQDTAGWQRAFDTLSPGNQAWVKDAPLLVLVAADSLFKHNIPSTAFTVLSIPPAFAAQYHALGWSEKYHGRF
jgi:nitroreductase